MVGVKVVLGRGSGEGPACKSSIFTMGRMHDIARLVATDALLPSWAV